MNTKEFNTLCAATNMPANSRTRTALYHVLVSGMTGYAAAKKLDISQAAISRALSRFPSKVCPTCGQAIKGK